MSYDVDELFRFRGTEGGYSVEKYLKRDDPSVTELEIPAEYNGKPVIKIGKYAFNFAMHLRRVKIPPSVREILAWAFNNAKKLEELEFSEGLELISNYAFSETGLKSAALPKSLKELYWGAFKDCRELESVRFNSSPNIQLNVFHGCPKLPPETAAIGLVRSTDITKPIHPSDLAKITDKGLNDIFDCFRGDVFELLAKNNCFRDCDSGYLFVRMAEENAAGLFPLAEKYGMTPCEELADLLLAKAVEIKATEITAYLLDLKNRKFGFNGGNDFAL